MSGRCRAILAMSATTAILACAIHASESTPATAPATAPSTQAAGLTVRGRVSVSGAWALQKPDLSRAVIFIASAPALDERSGPTTRASVIQRHKTFSPNFLVVPRGTSVEFPNWDDFDHNVFSRSAAAPAFDLDRYPYGQSKTRTFEKLGVVQIFCNIHPQMRAVIYVTPNRFFARADADGRFEINGLPPGGFEVVVWNERCEEQRQTVELRAGESSEISFTLTENRDRVLISTDPAARRASAYGGVERGLGVKRERLNLPVVTDVHQAPEDSRP